MSYNLDQSSYQKWLLKQLGDNQFFPNYFQIVHYYSAESLLRYLTQSSYLSVVSLIPW